MDPVISDYIPSMSFLEKLQGKERLLIEQCDDAIRVVNKMMELEKHRERAKEGGHGDGSEDYVPDVVDMMTAEPLDGGKPLPERTMALFLLVRSIVLPLANKLVVNFGCCSAQRFCL